MTGIGRRGRRILSSGLCGPIAVMLVSLLLLYDVAVTGTLGVPDGAYGPLSWPLFALILLVAGVALLCAVRTRACIAAAPPLTASSERAPTEQTEARVLVAIVLIALYGVAFVYAGFLFGTIAFLAAWLAFARFRRPLSLALVSVLGAVLPLYLLIKVAYTPLPRGVGVIEQATLQLYQWLHLF